MIDQGQENPLRRTPEERLTANVEKQGRMLDALVEFAVSRGADRSKFEHIKDVPNPDHYFCIPNDKMPPGVRALTINRDVFVREDQVDNPHILLHESVHRAKDLKTGDRLIYQETIAGLYGFTFRKDSAGKIIGLEPIDKSALQNVPEADRPDYLEEWKQRINSIAAIFIEGLTEWVVLRANGLTTKDGEIIALTTDEIYQAFDMQSIDGIRDFSGLTKEEFEALAIETALTGNISDMIPKLGDSIITFLEMLGDINLEYREVQTSGKTKKQMEAAPPSSKPQGS